MGIDESGQLVSSRREPLQQQTLTLSPNGPGLLPRGCALETPSGPSVDEK